MAKPISAIAAKTSPFKPSLLTACVIPSAIGLFLSLSPKVNGLPSPKPSK